jgi:PilZ domain-containing protein
MTARPDLRSSTRHILQCPVTLGFDRKTYRSETIDISANGVLLRTQCPVSTGAYVHYTIELPNISVKVKCRGRVIRCSPTPNYSGHDIAIVIDDYRLQPFRKRSVTRPLRKAA